jgi:ankyrin repeat protein
MYDQDGKTALHRAVEMGDAVVVKALLAKGASITPFPVSHSVLWAWCGIGCRRDFDPFQDWRFLGFVNPQDEWTPLHVAAKNGLVLIAQLLLDWGSTDYTLRVRHIAIKLSRDRRFNWFVCVRSGLTVWKKTGSDAVSQSVSQSVSEMDLRLVDCCSR